MCEDRNKSWDRAVVDRATPLLSLCSKVRAGGYTHSLVFGKGVVPVCVRMGAGVLVSGGGVGCGVGMKGGFGVSEWGVITA